MEKADEYLKALHELRLLVFLECDGTACEDVPEAQIDGHHFHQVGLTDRQFKKVSEAISMSIRQDDSLKEGYEMAEIRYVGTISGNHFDGLNSTI